MSSTDPIMMRYKSSPHIVFTVSNREQEEIVDSQDEGQCLLVELSKDISDSPYVTDDSYNTIMQRQWVPCGPTYQILDER